MIHEGIQIDESGRQSDRIAELEREVAELKEKLYREGEEHAHLQSMCYDNGHATHTSIFDEVAELRTALSTERAEHAKAREALRQMVEKDEKVKQAALCLVRAFADTFADYHGEILFAIPHSQTEIREKRTAVFALLREVDPWVHPDAALQPPTAPVAAKE